MSSEPQTRQHKKTKVIANIQFFPPIPYGRKQNIPAIKFNCPLFFIDIPALSSHGYDCRIFLDKYGKEVVLGDYVENIPIAFLSPEEVLPNIHVGTEFYVWEYVYIAKGRITKIEKI